MNQKLSAFIAKTVDSLRENNENLFDLENLIDMLEENEGYSVKNIKAEHPDYHQNTSITLYLKAKGIQAQVLKVHPDDFENLRDMYNDTESLQKLARLGLAAKVNWTGVISDYRHENGLRIVFYDYLDGPTLDSLPKYKSEPLIREWKKQVEKLGFYSFAEASDFVLSSQNKPVLTDYNQIVKATPEEIKDHRKSAAAFYNR